MTKDTPVYELGTGELIGHNVFVPLQTSTPAPSQDSDSIMMPKALTAENGAKHAFIGEFTEQYESHDGIISYVPVTWTTIKEIYKKAVELFGEPVQSPRPRDDLPAGYVLVPVEPSLEQLGIGANALDPKMEKADAIPIIYKIWKAMLAATPKSDGSA